MIRGIHAMFYSSAADELRAFLRDNFSLPTSDVGGGWLLFDVAEAEIGVHPADESQMHAQAGTHAISLFCDDIHKTVAELKAKGVEFTNEIADQGFGLITRFRVPGGVEVDLYQPFYKKETAPRPLIPGAPVEEPPTPPKAQERKKPPGRARTVKRKTTAKKKAPAKKQARKQAKKAATKKAQKKKTAKKSGKKSARGRR
jgi:predicted enzyme related to lactoylglutathione lyase